MTNQDNFKVLFIITIKDSFGERTHALSLIKQLKQLSKQNNFNSVVFVGNVDLKTFFQKQGIKTFFYDKYENFTASIINEKPNLIVCCEYYHFVEEFRQFLLAQKIPIATIDGTSIGDEINSNPFKINSLYNKNNILPSSIIKLRPCPINDPLSNTENIKYWNLFPKTTKNILNTEFIKEYYKICENEKIIFMAISGWELSSTKFWGIDPNNFYNTLFNTLFSMFQTQKYKITFFIISPFKQQIIKNKNLTVHFLNILEYDFYQKLLLSSDLVLSTNIIQTSMSQALMAKINTLALINTKENLFVHKFNIFPLKVLFPKTREYYQLINKAEIFDEKDILEKINLSLSSDNKNQNIDNFIIKINNLENIQDIIKKIIKIQV